jgi:thioredoxin-like negative regulator of GroEL
MSTPTSGPLHVACLCAAWCRLCDSYGPVFEAAIAALRLQHGQVQAHWIDIEDEADLVGDYDVETFPTLVVADARQVLFAGPLTPQPETLQRVLRAALASAAQAGPDARPPAEVQAFADRLRRTAGADAG